jgi:hypothetical protein
MKVKKAVSFPLYRGICSGPALTAGRTSVRDRGQFAYNTTVTLNKRQLRDVTGNENLTWFERRLLEVTSTTRQHSCRMPSETMLYWFSNSRWKKPDASRMARGTPCRPTTRRTAEPQVIECSAKSEPDTDAAPT